MLNPSFTPLLRHLAAPFPAAAPPSCTVGQVEKQEAEAARALAECEKQEAALAKVLADGAEATKEYDAALAQLNAAKVRGWMVGRVAVRVVGRSRGWSVGWLFGRVVGRSRG